MLVCWPPSATPDMNVTARAKSVLALQRGQVSDHTAISAPSMILNGGCVVTALVHHRLPPQPDRLPKPDQARKIRTTSKQFGQRLPPEKQASTKPGRRFRNCSRSNRIET